LGGKYYGTAILDADGKTVCNLWLTGGDPSEREDIDPEDICNDHYETERTYVTAKGIVDLMNAMLIVVQTGGSDRDV
jgi:hypothetical protein